VRQHIQPARSMNMFRTRSNAFTFNVGRPSEALLGRAPVIPCARAVGGGSSVNCRFLVTSSSFRVRSLHTPTVMAYNRASASDYDYWETTFGNRGWGSDKLIPLLKKVVFVVYQNLYTELPLSGRDLSRSNHK